MLQQLMQSALAQGALSYFQFIDTHDFQRSHQDGQATGNNCAAVFLEARNAQAVHVPSFLHLLLQPLQAVRRQNSTRVSAASEHVTDGIGGA